MHHQVGSFLYQKVAKKRVYYFVQTLIYPCSGDLYVEDIKTCSGVALPSFPELSCTSQHVDTLSAG